MKYSCTTDDIVSSVRWSRIVGEDETRSSVGYVQMSRGHPRPRPRHRDVLNPPPSSACMPTRPSPWPWPPASSPSRRASPGGRLPGRTGRRGRHLPMEPFVAVATLQDYGAGRICSRSRAPPTCLVQPLMDRTGRGGPRQAHLGLRGSIPASSVTPSGLGDVPRGSSDPGEELEQVADPGPEALLLHHVACLVGPPTHPAPAQTSSSASRDGRVRESKRIRANAGGAPSGHRAVGSHRFDVRQGQRADPLSLPPGYAEHAQQVLR